MELWKTKPSRLTSSQAQSSFFETFSWILLTYRAEYTSLKAFLQANDLGLVVKPEDWGLFLSFNKVIQLYVKDAVQLSG